MSYEEVIYPLGLGSVSIGGEVVKTATYRDHDGKPFSVEYDPDAPCNLCGEPVIEASVGGTAICPWCDMGKCRYCGVKSLLVRETLDGGDSLKRWRDHMAWHRAHPHLETARLSEVLPDLPDIETLPLFL